MPEPSSPRTRNGPSFAHIRRLVLTTWGLLPMGRRIFRRLPPESRKLLSEAPKEDAS